VSQDPSELTPREAAHRYLDRRRQELTEDTIQSYYYRLKLWWEWCEDQNVHQVGDLSGWLFEQYEAHRSGEDLAASTIHNEMETLEGFVSYLERIEAVDGGLSEKVHVPTVPKDQRSREKMLEPDDAITLIKFYRQSDDWYGTRFHAFLELAWHTAARVGAIRALDLRDYDRSESCIEFIHRPETDTGLKNKNEGERMVSLLDPVCDALNAYLEEHRHDRHDSYGRSPLFTSMQGRPQPGTFRTWSYQATQPCLHEPCPHGYNRETCEFITHNKASQCPSSRSPHHVRTGSMTWHRDRGVPKEVLRERANASEDVIEEYYDKAGRRDRMEIRRRPHLHKLEIE